jgi:hypothetical protein
MCKSNFAVDSRIELVVVDHWQLHASGSPHTRAVPCVCRGRA